MQQILWITLGIVTLVWFVKNNNLLFSTRFDGRSRGRRRRAYRGLIAIIVAGVAITMMFNGDFIRNNTPPTTPVASVPITENNDSTTSYSDEQSLRWLTETVNLRAEPGADQQIIRQLPSATKVEMAGRNIGGWVLVRVGYYEGWVWENLLSSEVTY